MNGPYDVRVAAFASELAKLRDECGTPPFMEMEKLAVKAGFAMSHGTAHAAIQGMRLPQEQTVSAFVTACREAAAKRNRSIAAQRFDLKGWHARWTTVRNLRSASQSVPRVRSTGGEYIGPTGLASEHAGALLDAVSIPGYFAVDDAIGLSDWRMSAGHLRCRVADNSFDQSKYPRINDPTRAQLEHAIDAGTWDGEVSAYLRQQLPDIADLGSHDHKVSVARILRGKSEEGIPPEIILEPQLWWVEKTFNRQLLPAYRSTDIATSEDHLRLRRLGRRLASELLRGNDSGDYRFRFPAGFYVEVAVVDTEGQVLLLSKDPRTGSGEGQSGRRWTCSMERGVKVSDVVDGRVDLEGVAVRGLEYEEIVDRSDVVNVEFGAIALQSRHLNCAVLGVAKIRRSVKEIAAKANANLLPYHTEGRPVSLDDVADMIRSPSGEFLQSNWHVTGRLRMILALTQAGKAPEIGMLR